MKVKAWIMTNKIGSKMERTIEIPDDDFEGMTDADRDDYIYNECWEHMIQQLDFGWIEVKEG